MTPFLKPAGGNCHDTEIHVELHTVTKKLLGAFEGTAVEILKNYIQFFDKLLS